LPIPGFHEFLLERLGSPLRPLRVLEGLFLRPLAAPSLGSFWRQWNAPYAYILQYYIYRPLKQLWPRPVAIYMTFLASGFLLHDLPFNFNGELAIPKVTLLFAIFGALTLLSNALGIDLSRHPTWKRVLANLGWIGAGFAIRMLVMIWLFR
jgi:D-alanyl-lipoteichoic acid acyltransferase DltB (MBOAT superfamily)